jgi:hypothetical protein
MNPPRQMRWLVSAFAICFFVGGVICWRGSYQQYLETGFPWVLCGLLAGTAAVLSWTAGVRIAVSGLVVGSVFPAIILARIVLDGIHDPTGHNLWPFEVCLAFAFGMVMTFPAATLGWWLRRMTDRSHA